MSIGEQIVSGGDLVGGLLQLLGLLAFGSTLLVGLAALLLRFTSRLSAAKRCLVWQLALIAVLPLAVVGLVAPGIPVQVFTQIAQQQTQRTALRSDNSTAEREMTAAALGRQIAQPSVQATSPQFPTDSVETTSDRPVVAGEDTAVIPRETHSVVGAFSSWWRVCFAFAWLLTAITMLLRLAGAMLRVHWLVQSSSELSSMNMLSWTLKECGAALQLDPARLPVLLTTDRVLVPVASGCIYTRIVIPNQARNWTSERLRMALTHELAHHARHDVFWQLVCNIACSVVWFNPLVWYARRQALEHREYACDELVLTLGYPRTEYAEWLVELAADLSNRSPISLGALSMAKPPIHGRIRNILAWSIDRPNEKRLSSLVFVCLFASLTIAMGAVRPFASQVALAQESESKEPLEDAKIDVVVTDSDGDPIGGTTLRLLKWTGDFEPVAEERTNDEGHANFLFSAEDASYYLLFEADGFARTFRVLQFEPGLHKEVKFKLSPPCRPTVKVTAGEAPIAGAEFTRIEYVDINENKVYLNYQIATQLGFATLASDAEGVLVLPEIPVAAQLSVSVTHRDWRQTRIDDLVASAGLSTSAELDPGVTVTIQLGSEGESLKGERVAVIMMGDQSSTHSNTVRHSFPVQNGAIVFTASPVVYRTLLPEVKAYFSTPLLMNYPHAPNEQLDLSNLTEVEFRLQLLAKEKARGRIVDIAGEGIGGALVSAMVAKPSVDINAPLGSTADVIANWAMAGSAYTDENGQYEIEVAPGVVSFEVICEGFFSSPSTTRFVWTGDLEDPLPTKTLLTIPELSGIVVDTEGQPVIGAIVRMRHRGRMDPDPVGESSADGSFSLKMRRIPYSQTGEGLETTVYALAFDPRSGQAGITEVDLTDAAATDAIRVEIEPQSNDWPLKALPPNTQSDPNVTLKLNELRKERQREFALGMPGVVPPNMSEGSWLNTDATSLDDFRGKFVLLDFWFIGCGPCVRDMPSVKLAYQKFFNAGFTVVSVHSQGRHNPEEVQQYANQNGMNYPIVVDDSAGSIVKQYRERGLHGFPHYMLLNPEGRIVHNDALSIDGSLRMSKLELIHNYIRDYRDQEN